MNNCIGCKYYDSSVDCCNADENCYQVGLQIGVDKLAREIIRVIDEIGYVNRISINQIAEKIKEGSL